MAHRVIAEHAHQSAAKARQVLKVRHTEARHELGDVGHRVGMLAPLGNAVAGEQQHRTPGDGNAGSGGQPDEGIAPKAFSTLHRFEQISKWRVGQLEVNRQRRVEVGESFQGNGNAVIALGGQPVEFGFVHPTGISYAHN
jgi:hypothetical protein